MLKFLLTTLFGVNCILSYSQLTYTFDYRKDITIDETQVSGSTDLTDFPVLFKFTDPDLIYSASSGVGKVKNLNGYDIVFIAGTDCSPLSHEIEKYDQTTGELVVWVKIPVLSHNSPTVISMYYGNADYNALPNVNDVWSNGYACVVHMNECTQPTGASQVCESTVYPNAVPLVGVVNSSAFIDNSIGFDNVGDELTVVDDPVLKPGADDISLSAWVKVNTGGSNKYAIINKRKNGSDNIGYNLRYQNNGFRVAYRSLGANPITPFSLYGASLTEDIWHYVTATVQVNGLGGTGMARIYVDGVEWSTPQTLNIGGIADNTEPLRIGNRTVGFAGLAPIRLEGQMDEARVSHVLRSSDWIQTEYNNQRLSSPVPFYVVGTEFPGGLPGGPCTTILPVELMSFTATVTSLNHVNVEWETVTEGNNDFFTVEFSKNGMNWTELENVNSLGSASIGQSYLITDYTPLRGVSYYRLKQTDFNGTYSYSDMRSVTISDWLDDSIKCYPNPTNSSITIQGNEEDLSSIQIFNVLGQNVTDFIIKYNSNEYKIELDLSRLNRGTYFIKTETCIKKISKL